MKSFPPPLTATQEKEYLQRYIAGDLEAKHILIERNLRLVAHVVKKFQQPEEQSEDLLSIGTIGLIKAVLSFDPSKNNKLATYAAKCIENEILMTLRTKKKTAKEVSMYEPIGTDKEGNEIRLFDIIESPKEDVYHHVAYKEDVKALYEKMHILSPRERLVLKMRYGLYDEESYTQREVASLLGISRSYISRIEKRALQKLRAELEK